MLTREEDIDAHALRRQGMSISAIARHARHQIVPDGAGVMIRDHGHVIALEQLVLAGQDTSRPHRRKERIPPGPTALAAADHLRVPAPTPITPSVTTW